MVRWGFAAASVAVAALMAAAAGGEGAAKSAQNPQIQSTQELNAQANDAYLAANAKKPGVVVLPGLQYEVLRTGTGASASRHDCVSVSYRGSLINGKVFDETEPGKPAIFPAYLLIPGWTVALGMMHEGDVWRLTVPAAMGYGATGAGDGIIPADQTLIFEVALLKVSKPVRGRCS